MCTLASFKSFSTNQVSGWLKQILKLEKDVSRTLKDGEEQDQNKCLGGFCAKNFLLRAKYKLRAIVRKKLEVVEKLKTRGQFNAVVQKCHDPVEKIPIGVTVGLDFTLQKVRICIEDKTLGIIGLYGIGVVGKTTLLYKLNNEFFNVRHDFGEVILVLVSKQPALEMVQKTIMDKLDLSRDIGSPDSEQTNARRILERLQGKKFLLLLDDIWQKLGHSLVGILLPNDRNQSKLQSSICNVINRRLWPHGCSTEN